MIDITEIKRTGNINGAYNVLPCWLCTKNNSVPAKLQSAKIMCITFSYNLFYKNKAHYCYKNKSFVPQLFFKKMILSDRNMK